MAARRRTISRTGIFAAAMLAAGLVALPAVAQDALGSPNYISQALQQGAGSEWSDGFDTASVSAADVRTSIPTLSPEIVSAVQGAIAEYANIVARGGWPTVPADKALRLGMTDPAVAVLRQRLAIAGDLPKTAAANDSNVFDSYVDAAVRRFQARHGIQPDGVVGDSTYAALNVSAQIRLQQLATNLTRLKVLTAKPMPERYVMVNIPAASVEVVENGVVVQRHTAVVGKVTRPSPIVNSKITEINFHPYWTVPSSIIRKDLIPIMQKDPTYLATWHIRIYDHKGNEVQPTQINWQTDDAVNYMFRQDPGDFNSLGIVKINFPSPDGVYMHDTPHKGLFNDDFRFDSSGCVRVQNIRELITWILKNTPGQTADVVESELRNPEQVNIRVTDPVPLHWTYITAWATTDGVVNFRNDIYNLDGLDQLTASAAPADGTAPATDGAAPPNETAVTPTNASAAIPLLPPVAPAAQ